MRAETAANPDLIAKVLAWICANPGVDDEDVAEHFEIPDVQAVEIVGHLLEQGEVGYDE